MKKILGKINSIVYLLLVLGLIGIAFLNFNPQINFFNKLKFRALVVKSGSMEPAIKTGSLVLAKEMTSYQSGEIITFKNPAAPKELVTHRLFKIRDKNGREVMITKGDANKTEDQGELKPYHIMGKVFFILPYLGYLVHYSRQPVGMILLVAVPAFLIILIEVLKIREEILKIKERKRTNKLERNLTMMTVIFACLISFSSFLIFDSQAKFFDQEKATVTITAGVWCQPKIFWHLDKKKASFLFRIEDISEEFEEIAYELRYQAEEALQGVKGKSDLKGDSFVREIFLGSCSGNDCFVHENISDLKLNVLLTDFEGEVLRREAIPGESTLMNTPWMYLR